MKKITFATLISLFLFSCIGSSKLSQSGSKEKDIVKNLIDLMILGDETQMNEQYRPLISPKYIKENDINIDDYKINYYSPKSYTIESYDAKTGKIEAKIWGNNKTWAHLLEFKIVKENNKLYLYPEKHTNSKYVYPWYKVTTNVE